MTLSSTGRTAHGDILELRLPLPPSVNQQYANVGKRRVLTPVARRFRSDVNKIVESARTAGIWTTERELLFRASHLSVSLIYYFETPERRDLDGGLKITLDAVCDALNLDDRRIVELRLIKQIDPLQPHVMAELATLLEWTFDRTYVLLPQNEEEPTASNPI